MKEKPNLLNLGDIEILEKEFDILTFPNDFDLVYENQIPSTGVAILDGCVEMMKGSKIQDTITKGHVLGLQELLEEIPSKYGYRVKAHSKVVLIGKSQIIGRRNKKLSFLSSFRKVI